jgi:transcriptional regulator with XRE-family HTH domain
MDFAKAIRTVRAAKGLAQKDLAARSKLDASYISLLECGKRNPSLAIVEKIASALDVPLYVLMMFGASDSDLRFIGAEDASHLGGQILKALASIPTGPQDDATEGTVGVMGEAQATRANRARGARAPR